MESGDIGQYVFFAIFAVVAITFLYHVLKHGGIKGAMFGADIARTVGEVECARGTFMRTTVKVHVLGGDASERAVGLEVVTKSVASYQMLPVTLSATETRKLITLLQTATGV